MPGLVESTTYRVETLYDITDRASDKLKKVEKEAAAAAVSSQRLGSALAAIGGVFVGSRVFGAGKSALIDFNATVQDTKNTIGGMMALATKSDLNDNLARADRLYSNLQRRAATLPGTTAEYVAMAGMITQPIMDAGLRMKDLENLTVATVVGAKSLRVEAGAAARDIDQALRGQYHSVDVFTGKLLGAMGYSGEAGRKKFNALDAQKRASELMKAVDTKQIRQLAEAQGGTFTGVMSTLQDNFEQLAGKVGKPLFEAVTKEIKSWVDWLGKNQAKIDAFAKTVGEGLVSGFRSIKSAAMWVVDHAETLLTIGKVWAGVKVAGMLGGGIGGSIQGLMKFGSGAGGKLDAGGAFGNLGLLAGIGTASYMLTSELMNTTGAAKRWQEIIDPQRAAIERATQATKAWEDAINQSKDRLAKENGAYGTGTFATMRGAESLYRQQLNVLGDVRRQYGVGDNLTMYGKFGGTQGAKDLLASVGLDPSLMGDLDKFKNMEALLSGKISDIHGRSDAAAAMTDQRIREVMAAMPKDLQASIEVKEATQRVMQAMVARMASGQGVLSFVEVWDLLKQGAGTMDNFKGQAKPNVTNIKIDRVEVAAKDPDRWIHELDAKARSMAKAPRGARSSIQGRP